MEDIIKLENKLLTWIKNNELEIVNSDMKAGVPAMILSDALTAVKYLSSAGDD